MHQMCRLYDQVLNPVVDCSFQCLIHIVDLLIITGLYMVDDDLCCKCSSYRPVRICCLKCFFHTTDILCTAVIERCTKAYNQNFIFSDVIFVQWIIFRCIACIPSKIIRISVLAFYQFFLCISKLIPGFFCSLTLFICLVCSFLYINVIDQLCYFICRLLITVFGCFFCLFFLFSGRQKSGRYAFLGCQAHATQLFGLADHTARSVRQLVQSFVIVLLKAAQTVAQGEERVGEAGNLFVE